MSLFDVGTMTELLNRSLTGGVVILAVLALRLMMRRFPRKYVCILWLAAFGRLLFSIPVPAASSLFPAAEPLQQAAVEVDGRPGMGTVLQLSTGLEPVDSAVNELLWQLLEPSPATSADPVQIYAFAFQWLWLGGMAVLLLTGLFRYGLLKRRISDAVPAEETQCTVRGKRLERVYITDRIQMPMVLGIWKPRILLPSACSGEGRKEERELILAHEQAHRLRYDHVTKVFVFGVLVIHWFNPLAWAAFLLYCRDVEMACDEKVMEWLGEESRKPYSLALLRFEEERSALLIPLAFGESSAREPDPAYFKLQEAGLLDDCPGSAPGGPGSRTLSHGSGREGPGCRQHHRGSGRPHLHFPGGKGWGRRRGGENPGGSPGSGEGEKRALWCGGGAGLGQRRKDLSPWQLRVPVLPSEGQWEIRAGCGLYPGGGRPHRRPGRPVYRGRGRTRFGSCGDGAI